MRIIPYPKRHQKIEIIEIIGTLTDKDAMQLENYLYTCLDKNKRYILIGLGLAKHVESLWFSVLEYFATRGLQIRLFNVKLNTLRILRTLRKDKSLKIYIETNCDKVVSFFEKEILEESIVKDAIRKRSTPRVDTFLKMDFKFHPGHNGVILGRTSILNISEGGMYADQILILDEKTEEIVVPQEMAGQELYDMEFKLDDNSRLIEARGECVREIKTKEKLCAGIRFVDMEKDQKEMINNYINILSTQ